MKLAILCGAATLLALPPPAHPHVAPPPAPPPGRGAPPATFDEAAYITCREAHMMPAEARKQLAVMLAEHAARHHGVMVPDDQRGAQLAYLIRGGCTLAPDAYLFTVIDRAIV